MKDKVQMADVCEASVSRGASHKESTSISGYYTVECYNNGSLKWKDDIHNLVTTVGKNLTMDTVLGNSAAGAVVMGLKGTGTADVADTQASHGTWLEVGGTNAPAYTGNPLPQLLEPHLLVLRLLHLQLLSLLLVLVQLQVASLTSVVLLLKTTLQVLCFLLVTLLRVLRQLLQVIRSQLPIPLLQRKEP